MHEQTTHDRGYAAMRKALPENKKPKGKLTGFEVKLAENGYSVDCRYEPPKSEKQTNGVCCSPPWEPPKTKVFESKASLVEFLEELL
jgi:hypothetical protein